MDYFFCFPPFLDLIVYLASGHDWFSSRWEEETWRTCFWSWSGTFVCNGVWVIWSFSLGKCLALALKLTYYTFLLLTVYILTKISYCYCVQINNNLRCYDLAMELSNSTMEALPQNYAEQVIFLLIQVLFSSSSFIIPLSLSLSLSGSWLLQC